jgi:hypothetical protein
VPPARHSDGLLASVPPAEAARPAGSARATGRATGADTLSGTARHAGTADLVARRRVTVGAEFVSELKAGLGSAVSLVGIHATGAASATDVTSTTSATDTSATGPIPRVSIDSHGEKPPL